MMRHLHRAAVAAGNEVRRSDEMMTAAVALPRPADSLLGKRAHVSHPPRNCVPRESEASTAAVVLNHSIANTAKHRVHCS
jgi:hypothetical protein